MKVSKILAISVVAVGLSVSMNNIASADATTGFNVAVVDVQKVVENSPQINSLKTEQKNKVTDLMSFVEKAKATVNKETNEAKKKSLEDKYNMELNQRKQAIDSDYAKKLMEIDKSITATIDAKAAAYDLVLTKNSVIKGGVDITSEVIKELK